MKLGVQALTAVVADQGGVVLVAPANQHGGKGVPQHDHEKRPLGCEPVCAWVQKCQMISLMSYSRRSIAAPHTSAAAGGS